MEPDTRYASVDRARVAYQVLGEGPLDLVVTAGTFGSVDLGWEDPMVAAWNRRLASFSRLILFDRRGSGASDPLPIDDLPSWELYMDDLTAVMDAAGSDRAAIMGIFDAGPTAMLFAASRPERTVALVLANTSARILRSDDYPVGARPQRIEEVGSRIERTWGTEEQAEMQVPSRASDPQFRRWFARYTRSIAGPTAVSAYVRAMIHTDARSVLPSIRVPTLILHRVDYPWFRIEHGRYLAEHIEAARLVELPGADGPLPWEHAGLALDAIEEFLTGTLRGPDTTRAVTTLLFTDVVRSTERAAQLGDELWREVLRPRRRGAPRDLNVWGSDRQDDGRRRPRDVRWSSARDPRVRSPSPRTPADRSRRAERDPHWRGGEERCRCERHRRPHRGPGHGRGGGRRDPGIANGARSHRGV